MNFRRKELKRYLISLKRYIGRISTLYRTKGRRTRPFLLLVLIMVFAYILRNQSLDFLDYLPVVLCLSYCN